MINNKIETVKSKIKISQKSDVNNETWDIKNK